MYTRLRLKHFMPRLVQMKLIASRILRKRKVQDAIIYMTENQLRDKKLVDVIPLTQGKAVKGLLSIKVSLKTNTSGPLRAI